MRQRKTFASALLFPAPSYSRIQTVEDSWASIRRLKHPLRKPFASFQTIWTWNFDILLLGHNPFRKNSFFTCSIPRTINLGFFLEHWEVKVLWLAYVLGEYIWMLFFLREVASTSFGKFLNRVIYITARCFK